MLEIHKNVRIGAIHHNVTFEILELQIISL